MQDFSPTSAMSKLDDFLHAMMTGYLKSLLIFLHLSYSLALLLKHKQEDLIFFRLKCGNHSLGLGLYPNVIIPSKIILRAKHGTLDCD